MGRLLGGRCLLATQLGSGGFGRVWLAHDEQLDVSVAIKEVWLSETPATGVDVVLSRCGSGAGELWQYTSDTGELGNLASGRCLDTAGPPANNVNLVLDRCGNYNGEGWHL